MSINFNNPASLNLSLSENNPAGQGIGSFVANDTSGGLVTYSLSGADAGFFSIDNNGVLRPVRSFNYEQPADNGGNNIYDVVINASGTSGAVSGAVAVRVLNASEPPVFASPNIVAVPKNSSGDFYQILLNNVSQADPIVGYQLRGADAAMFTLDSATGNISFLAAPNYNVNGNNNYSIVAVVNASGPNGTYATSQVVQVNVVNETPAVFASGSNVVNVTADNTNAFYQVSNVIDNAARVNSYQILSGKDENLFWIDGNGAIYAKNGFDYDTDRHHYSIVVAVTTGRNNFVASQLVTIDLQPSTAQPGFAEYQNDVTAYQNSNIITTVEAAGAGVYSYRLFWGDMDFISIDSASGQLSFINNSKEHYAVWVEASNNLGQQYYQFVNIDVAPGNAPVAPTYRIGFGAGASGGTLEISENNVFGLPVGNYRVQDNTSNGIAYSVIGGDQLDFAIDSNGQLLFNEVAYYKTKNNYSVVVVATGHDNNGAIHQISQAVNLIIDQVGGATGSSGGGATGSSGGGATGSSGGGATGVAELSPVWTPITGRQYVLENTVGTGVFLNAVDPNGVYNVSYSLSDNRFSINSAGEVEFVNAPDYENSRQPKLFTLVATAFDMNGGAAPTSVSTVIELLNTNDSQPQIYDDSHLLINGVTDNYIFDANQPIDWSLSFSASDPDGGLVVFSLSDNINFSLNNGNVTYIGPQRGAAQHYTVQLIATSLYQPTAGGVDAGNVASIAQIIDIVGTPNPTPNIPGFVGGNGGGLGGNGAVLASINENNAPNIVVGSFLATDAGGVAISYSVNDSNFSIDQNGLLYFNSAADYETTKFYSAVITASVDGNSISQSFVLDILNTNDNAPALSGAAVASVFENNAAGVALGLYQASDADGGAISYSVDDSNFSIDQNGLLYFNSAADYETTKFYSVIVTATSQNQPGNGNASNVVTKLVVLDILNTNDNAPAISGAAIASVFENNAAGVALGLYQASDADGGAISYSVNDINFSIDQNGLLRLNTVTNYPTQQVYSIIVAATSQNQPGNGNASNLATELVVVNVLSVNDHAPTISGAAVVSVLENNARGVILGLYQASDADNIPGISAISYSVDNGNFSIDQNGILYFNSVADYEMQNAYTVTITAASQNQSSVGNASNTVTEVVVVNVLNANDNNIQFAASAPASFAINPNNAAGLALGNYSALDADGGSVLYQINDYVNFSIDQQGELYFAKVARYSTQASYSVMVTAISLDQPFVGNGNNYASELVVVNVNKPYFAYAAGVVDYTLPNHNPLYSYLGSAALSDSEGNVVLYSVSNIDFSVETTGAVYFNPSADYATKNLYSAVVTAYTNGGLAASEIVVVSIIAPSNDHAPQFTMGPVNLSVLENYQQMTVAQYQATDIDGGTVSLSLGANNRFSLDSNGNLILFSRFDYEKIQTYSLVLNAHANNQPAGGLASNDTSLLVTISIGNMNDNNPVFATGVAFSSIQEGQAPGIAIAQYSAYDPDGGGISYSIVEATNSFSIDQAGMVYFKATANASLQSLYLYSVVARSINQPAISYNVVTDVVGQPGALTIGNNPNPDTYQFYLSSNVLYENATYGAAGYANIFDSQPGNISYWVGAGSNFIIDQYGDLFNISAYDYETASTATVVVYGQSAGRGYPISQLVVVSIINVNDNAPQFVSPMASLRILENTAGFSLAAYNAFDADGGGIVYSVSDNHFSIDSNGTLYLTSGFDYETNRFYSLVVTAASLGQSATGNASNAVSKLVVVSIGNVNDNAVQFTSGQTLLSLTENNAAGQSLGVYQATDLDGGAITYGLSNATYFSLDSNNVLHFNSVANYDLTKFYSVVITAGATNQPATGNASNVVSELVVVDVLKQIANNHAPSFTTRNIQVTSVLEGSPAGIILGQFQATDLDGGNISYSISSFNYLSIYPTYSIDQNGVVYLTNSPSFDQVVGNNLYTAYNAGFYAYTVVATSYNQPAGGSANNVLSVVEHLQLININDEVPYFYNWATGANENATTIFSIDQGNNPNLVLGTFYAADPDGGGLPIYSINNPTDFSIQTGYYGGYGVAVRLNSTTNYDVKNLYSLVITAQSTYQPLVGNASNYASKLLVVDVLNTPVNRYAPVFAAAPVAVSMADNNAIGVSIANFSAYDADNVGGISYYLSDNANFSIDQHGVVYFESVANYDVQSHYTLVVYAHSTNQPVVGSASNDVSQTLVLDILAPWKNNNAPVFVLPPSTLAVHENIASTQVVYSFGAIDADGARDGNGNIIPITFSYSIDDTTHFSIDQSGAIYAKNVDYETSHFYTLLVTAMAQNQSLRGNASNYVSTSVVISIINDNDNAPVFAVSATRTTAYYDVSLTAVAAYSAVDADGGTISYFVNDTANFSITNNGQLNYVGPGFNGAPAHYSVIVTAQSFNQPAVGGAANVVSVLEVLDVVDPVQSHYIPQFSGLTNGYTYTGRISEHNVTPLAIATFAATDAAGAPISYYLTSNPNNYYSISQDGKLYLLVSTNAASPSGNSINGLRINATTIDQSRGGTGGNVTSFVNYNLNITPINDPSDVPTFTAASYNYSIDQNNNGPLTLGHIVAQPVAYMPVANNVHYTLNDTANFALTYYSIDGSMDLRFIGNANHAVTPYYSLIITATSANPAPYNQTTQLVVLAVSSVSTPPNHNLTFNSNVNNFGVSEANTTNVYIGNLGATDPDLVGVVNGISYSISGADSALFSLNKYTGDLTFTGQANYLNQTSYSLVITANTTNYQPDSISELVVVHVDQVIGNVVGNNVAANFDGMHGTNGEDSFTVYYSTGNQPWTGLLAGNTGIVLYNYNPNFDHITLNSFATNIGISGGPGGINSAQAFDNAYGNDISLLNGDINVLLGNGIQLYITRANDSNGNPQDFMSPTTGLANGHISFNDFLQLIGGSSHIDFVG